MKTESKSFSVFLSCMPPFLERILWLRQRHTVWLSTRSLPVRVVNTHTLHHRRCRCILFIDNRLLPFGSSFLRTKYWQTIKFHRSRRISHAANVLCRCPRTTDADSQRKCHEMNFDLKLLLNLSRPVHCVTPTEHNANEKNKIQANSDEKKLVIFNFRKAVQRWPASWEIYLFFCVDRVHLIISHFGLVRCQLSTRRNRLLAQWS